MAEEHKKKQAVKIERRKLLDGLTIIKDTIKPDSKNITDSSNFLIIQDGRLHCKANQFMISVPMGLDIDRRLVNVEFQLVYDYLRKLRHKEVIIGITNNNTLGIKAGDNSRVEFPINTEFRFDEEDYVADPGLWKPLPETFVNALTFTSWASDTSNAISSHVVIADGKMYGHSDIGRMTCFDMKQDGQEAFPTMVFVHADCLNFANKYMGFDPVRGTPSYAVQGSWLHLRTLDGVIMSSRTRCDDNFDVEFAESMLEPGDSDAFRFPKEFEEILDRANPFSGKDAKVKKVTIYISNELRTAQGIQTAPADISFMELRAVREDGSNIYERCDIRKVARKVRFSINISMLEHMVKYGETFRVGSRTFTAIGSTDNGRDDGMPMYRASCVLMAED